MGLSPQQWDRVKELFAVAVDSAPGERDDFLHRSEPDWQVRAEVQRLVEEQDRLGSFLSKPAAAAGALFSNLWQGRVAEGQMLAGRFRIVSFIAAGGMGEVYKAEDTRLHRLVALKFLPDDVAEDREALDRFQREAQAASALNHPNICTVYDFGEDGHLTFIAMEYLQGDTLSARIKSGPLPIDEAMSISLSVASALGAAHCRGIVHRDLKPGNIMLTETGTKLLDFGLAKYERPRASGGETLDQELSEARIIGTLPYMPPEQLSGGEVDPRGDIYAFGAVIYEMITGKKAFPRRSSAPEHEEPTPVRDLARDIPEKLEKIIVRCLKNQATERYGSVAEIERELKECLQESASQINLSSLLKLSRRPAVAVPVILLLILVVSAGGWYIHHAIKIRWAREQALPQISNLDSQDKNGEAYALAVEAERYIPKDPMLVKLWSDISWIESINTNPPGASVYRRAYNTPNSPWEFVGRTPIKQKRFAAVDTIWKFEMPGCETVERATFPSFPFSPAVITMDKKETIPVGMVRVDLTTPDAKLPKSDCMDCQALKTHQRFQFRAIGLTSTRSRMPSS